MKKTLFILLFLLPFITFAQKKSIDGFMDIPFGSDSVTVKAAVAAKGGIKDDTLSKKDLLMFLNFPLSRRNVRNLVVKFTGNKAFDAFFYFLYNDDEILNSYDNLVNDITAIYGKPVLVNNFPEFRSTAVKIRKMKAGDISVETVWQSKNKNTVSVQIQSINQVLLVVLRYEDDALFDIDAAKKRSDL